MSKKGHKITFNESESVEINLNISKDTMELLEKVAKKQEWSVKLLVKFFISKGLRDLEPELTKEFAIKKMRSRKHSNTEIKVDLAA